LQVIYIRKKTIIGVTLILIAVLAIVLYSKNFWNEALGVLFNNERTMPIYCVEVPDKRVALTFDAAWGDGYTQDIIDTLKRYDTRATFFITGVWAEKYPELVQEMVEYNYEIGNHSFTHVNMARLSRKSIVAEIKDTESNIERACGVKTKLFRAPFGDYNDELVSAAKDLKYNMIQWDIDSLDWQGVSSQEIFDRVMSKVSNGSIILFHNNTKNTTEALSSIITELRRDGYKFETISSLILKDNYYIDSTGRQRSLK
jgi:polysaccharide deacetylase family sporulation protein PdaB